MKNLGLSNHGERLIPGFSHDLAEVIRHKSSYSFFKQIILHDLKQFLKSISILDIGCGSGHGTFMLSEIPNCRIVAIDIETDAISFAREHFSANNITYINTQVSGINPSEQFDYIISRHSFEHIENIFHDILLYKPKRRLIANVPYKEKPGNPYHFYFNIDETTFANWPQPEFFYEDLDGRTFSDNSQELLNSIICVSSFDPVLDKISAVLDFPIPAWQPNYAEKLAYENSPRMYRLEADIASKRQLDSAHLQVIHEKSSIDQIPEFSLISKDMDDMPSPHQNVIDRIYNIQSKNEELKILASLVEELLLAQQAFVEHAQAGNSKKSSLISRQASEKPTPKLGGESFSEVLAIYNKDRLPGVLKLLASENITFKVKADALSALAKNIRDKEPTIAAKLAFMAWQYDPRDYRLKWYAHRLADAHEEEKAHAILGLLPKDIEYGAYETKRNALIRGNVKNRHRHKALLSECELVGQLELQIKSLNDKIADLTQKNNQNEKLIQNFTAKIQELTPKAQKYEQTQAEQQAIEDILNKSIANIQNYVHLAVQESACSIKKLHSLLAANKDRIHADQYNMTAPTGKLGTLQNTVNFLYGRFGMICKWIDLHNMNYDQYKSAVLDAEALNTRLNILLGYQLPLLALAAQKFPIFYHIASSINLPEPVLQKLRMANSHYNFLQIDFYDEDSFPNYKQIFQKKLIELNAAPDSLVSVTKVYEDDILHPSFFDHLSRYMLPAYTDFCVSFPRGYYGLYNGEKYSKFANARIANVPIGITSLVRYKDYELASPALLPPGNEFEIDKKSPIIEDSSFAAYIYSVPCRLGGTYLKHGKDANYIEEKYFSHDLADYQQVDDYYFNIFTAGGMGMPGK